MRTSQSSTLVDAYNADALRVLLATSIPLCPYAGHLRTRSRTSRAPYFAARAAVAEIFRSFGRVFAMDGQGVRANDWDYHRLCDPRWE